MVTKTFNKALLWKRNHGAVVMSKKCFDNSTALQFQVPKPSSQFSLNISDRIIEREDLKTGAVLWSWKDACSWCKMRHCGNSFGGHLKLLAKGWFWAIEELKIVRDHDWRFKKLSKGFPENCNFLLEMPKEESTFDQFSIHLVPKKLNIEELRRFGKASLRGWEGLCAFFIDFCRP